MRYVILRDDDTHALTPVERLEELYRPFLQLGLPVNLAVIPEVRTQVKGADGRPEGYLSAGLPCAKATVRMEESPKLLAYLRENSGFRVLQHGCYHDYFEFDNLDRTSAEALLSLGAERLKEAGLGTNGCFVAPYDRISKGSLLALAEHYELLSTGWFELNRQPSAWLSRYLWKKLRRADHWQVGGLKLLSHPGCLLSYTHPYHTIMDTIREQVNSQQLTVLVTHWWEYFREGRKDQNFLEVLHETAAYLAREPNLQVITFDDIAQGRISLA